MCMLYACFLMDMSSLCAFRNEYRPVATAGAGALAALVSDGVFIPFDVVKQRMQLNKTSIGFFSIVSKVYKERGIGAFFAGYTTTLVMEVPYTAVHFVTYEGVKHFLLHYRGIPDDSFSLSSHLIAGAMAGTVASGVTNPLDVVKTRLQTQGEVRLSLYFVTTIVIFVIGYLVFL